MIIYQYYAASGICLALQTLIAALAKPEKEKARMAAVVKNFIVAGCVCQLKLTGSGLMVCVRNRGIA